MSMEHWWTDIDSGKQQFSEKNLSQCYSVYPKSHIKSRSDSVGTQQKEAALTMAPSFVVL